MVQMTLSELCRFAVASTCRLDTDEFVLLHLHLIIPEMLVTFLKKENSLS